MKKPNKTIIKHSQNPDNKTNPATALVRCVGRNINHSAVVLCAVVLLLVATTGTAYATTPATSTADTLWATISSLIETWVTRLGAVIMFVGGIMFGLGWKSDDAEQKSRGISTLIAGAIVTAVAALTATFFA